MEYIVILILFGVAAAVVASNKGKSGGLWFIIGMLLGPFGLLFAFLSSEDRVATERKQTASGDMRKCPYCAEMIKREAVKCRYCQSEVEAVASGIMAITQRMCRDEVVKILGPPKHITHEGDYNIMHYPDGAVSIKAGVVDDVAPSTPRMSPQATPGVCPHCSARVKPEDTHCRSCRRDLTMENE